MIFSLAITGPTASGKTALSLSLAERLGCEIISCDSMQIYQGMDIGTAKATADERARVPHHLIDFLPPCENYSVESYRESAIRCAEEITSRGKTPLFVGGTGLYIDSLMRAAGSDVPGSDPEYREAILSSIKSDEDITALWERLLSVDPESAEKIHKNNVKRVIRALEIYDKTGRTKTDFDKQSLLSAPEIYVGMITLDFHNRENLYKRVDTRVDIMMREGLLDEVERLYRANAFGTTSSQAIGYKELIEYLDGNATLDEAVEALKLASRRYAKRQLTWFRHEQNARVIYADTDNGRMRDADEILAEALSLCGELLRDFNERSGTSE
ncbi:MAG: tRNA (adenosine(37)-N6)-dimethylallyltransferase MiaA [Clostridia bacterium]|nr:tRNA (adenosine(37)-N6)-dimethylallyltransferase MiaA [Clostridia bacterium]